MSANQTGLSFNFASLVIRLSSVCYIPHEEHNKSMAPLIMPGSTGQSLRQRRPCAWKCNHFRVTYCWYNTPSPVRNTRSRPSLILPLPTFLLSTGDSYDIYDRTLSVGDCREFVRLVSAVIRVICMQPGARGCVEIPRGIEETEKFGRLLQYGIPGIEH